MPTYQYVASSAKGENIRGSIAALDKGDLTRKLKEKGLFLVSFKIDEATMKAAATGAPAYAAGAGGASEPSPSGFSATGNSTGDPSVHSEKPRPAWMSFLSRKKVDPNAKPGGSIKLKELVVFTRQVSISINAGMSFVDALQGIQQHTRNPLLAYTLKHVLEDVLSGKKMSEALGKHPDIFKAIYVNMVAAGEIGGFVPEALNRVAEFLEKEVELRSKIKSAMVYPAVIGVVAFLVIIFMMTFIVPIFIEVFNSMNAPLPLPTKILIVVSTFFRRGGFLTPVIMAGIFVWLLHFRKKNEKFREFWDEKVLGLPLFGKLTTLSIVTRFIRTLATLVDNGVMALQAIGMARQVVENRTIEKVVDEIYLSVQQGNGISPVLYRSKYFPVLVANMVSTGEKTGELPTVLVKMADYYDNEVSSAVRDLLTMMEPLLIVVMAIVVGFVIAGLMLPTFQMSSLVGA